MSDKSNNQGRGYEYACLIALRNEIGKYRKVEVIENSCYQASLNAWNTLGEQEKIWYTVSAIAMTSTLFKIEPLLIEEDNDVLKLMIQPDSMGELGDVRDILARHIMSPVRFSKSLLNMKSLGVDNFIEVGPGKTLSGFVKRI